MNTPTKAITLYSFIKDLHSSMDNTISFADMFIWLHDRNVADLFDIWEGVGYSDEYKPSLIDLSNNLEVTNLIDHMVLSISGHNDDLVGMYDKDGGFPIGIFMNVNDAAELNGHGINETVISACIMKVADLDRVKFDWAHSINFKEDHPQGCSYLISNVNTKEIVVVNTLIEVSNHVGIRDIGECPLDITDYYRWRLGAFTVSLHVW